MRIKYKGYPVDFNVKQFIESSTHDKLEVLSMLIKDNMSYHKQRWYDYWIGYVDVHEDTISICNDDGSMTEKIDCLSVSAGRKGDGQIFNNLTKPICEQLVRNWKGKTNKRYRLHLDLGGSIYQEYDFTKHQRDILIQKLEVTLEKEWFNVAEE